MHAKFNSSALHGHLVCILQCQDLPLRVTVFQTHQSLVAPALDETIMTIQVGLRTLASREDTEQTELCARSFLDWTPRGSKPPNKPVRQVLSHLGRQESQF